MFENFTPWASLAGGALVGASATLLLWVNGRIAGISGVVAGLVTRARGDKGWRVSFLTAMVAVGVAAHWVAPSALGPPSAGTATLAVAGLLVGVGTRLANGCTSGHGVCGVSRLSRRSILATATFVVTGVLTTSMFRALQGVP
jgi:uncharacterized membrane protein YedE/YeeE